MVYPRPHPVPAGTGNPRGLPGIDPPNPLYSANQYTMGIELLSNVKYFGYQVLAVMHVP